MGETVKVRFINRKWEGSTKEFMRKGQWHGRGIEEVGGQRHAHTHTHTVSKSGIM